MTMPQAQAEHTSAAFMDIMKLRLLYLAEVLLRGYNALLTDADAVFYAPPFAVLPPGADLVVACDSTVVPLDWRLRRFLTRTRSRSFILPRFPANLGPTNW